MKDKKNIDRLFQEKFKDFDVSPKDHIWEGIEHRLHPKKKKRRVIPIWWSVGGIAAALVLMFAVGNTIFNSKDNIVPIIVDTKDSNTESDTKIEKDQINTLSNDANTSVASENNSDAIKNTNTEKSQDVKPTLNKNKTTSNTKDYRNVVAGNLENQSESSPKNTSAVNKAVANTNSKNNNPSKSRDIIKSQSKIDKILKSTKKDHTKVLTDATNSEKLDKKRVEDAQIDPSKVKENITKKGQSIEEAIAEANTIIEKEEELSRWSISPNVAPVYFNSLGRGSTIGPQFNANGTDSDVTISYGIQGSYAINKRLKVKAGVNNVNFNRATENVLALSGSGAVARGSTPIIGNITLNSNTEPITLLSPSNISNDTAPQSVITLPTGNLEQRFGFIEVPLELEYLVIDKKLGVSFIGGFSTFFLNENDIFTTIDGTSTLIGEANNLNSTSYSANFGVGFNYNLSKQLNLNLEPKFKYQINTFNNTSGDFQPFFIGVYTGLSFKF